MFCKIRKELNILESKSIHPCSYVHAHLNDLTLLSCKTLKIKVKPCSRYVYVFVLCCMCMLLMNESRILLIIFKCHNNELTMQMLSKMKII